MNKEWKIFPYNFENIFNAMTTLFFLSTFESYGKIFTFTVNAYSQRVNFFSYFLLDFN